MSLARDETCCLFIELPHLCDHIGLCDSYLASLQAGTTLTAIVLDKHAVSNRIRLSLKQSLVKHAQSADAPRALADFKCNDIVPGYVASVSSFGYFIKFWSGMVGVAGRQQHNSQTTDPLYKEGQSVFARISRVWSF